jgi:hypothetical protein
MSQKYLCGDKMANLWDLVKDLMKVVSKIK